MKAMRIVLAAGLAVILAATLRAQTPAPTITGFWLVQDTAATGSWQEWWDNGPGVKAKVRPEIVKLNAEDAARVSAGNVVNTAGRGRGQQADDCANGNLAMSFASSGAQEIAVSATEIKLGPQTVYMDGRPHLDAKSPAYKATGNGHSTGRWQGDTLLVDTIGFPAKMCDTRWRMMRVTGGGRAKETTHLTQRVRLMDANTLLLTFTWEDPTIYVEPYTYTYTFKQIPKPAEDPAQAPPKRQFLTDKYWPR
jgi:hypothetical protein